MKLTMETSGDDDAHPIFNHDPGEWMQYVNREVCVSTEKDKTYSGWVYTIDPVSHSVVLANFDNDDKIKMTVVMGHTIQNFVVINDNSDKHKSELERLFKSKEMLDASPEELKKKQEKLKSWLLKNRIPVRMSDMDSEQLTIADALTIDPPYEAENCCSTNEIILGRVQGLIKNMPANVEDW